MSHRSPNFIVVGLIIIMFVIGFFYMSCSSTTTELRRTLLNFEDRVRSLTIKTNDYEKEIDVLNTSRLEFQEKQTSLMKQLEQKDADINDLTVRLNEQNAEMQSLKTDRQVLEERIKDLQNTSDNLHSKNSEMEKFQQNFHEQKNINEQQVNELKQQIEKYKQQIDQLQHILDKPSVKLDQNASQIQPLDEKKVINQNPSIVNNSDVQPQIQPPVNNASLNETQIKANPPVDIDLNGANLADNVQKNLTNGQQQQQQQPIELNKREEKDDEDDAQLDNVESNKNN